MSANQQWLLFSRADQYFALPGEQVMMNLSAFACAVLPEAPAGVAGLFSFEGEALPLLDLAAIHHRVLPPATNCLVVQADNWRRFGLLSDGLPVFTETSPEAGSIRFEGKIYPLLDTQTMLDKLYGVAG